MGCLVDLYWGGKWNERLCMLNVFAKIRLVERYFLFVHFLSSGEVENIVLRYAGALRSA
jgi:hypothetical protein